MSNRHGRFLLNMAKNKSGRPKITLSVKEKKLAIQYVQTSGLFKNRLADFLMIGRRTLYRLLDRDKDFGTRLLRADSIFCADLVKRANPTKILQMKYSDEFKDKLSIEHSADKRLDDFLDRQSARLL